MTVKVKNISMRFNMSSEIIHSFKEYIIKLLKRELFFKEFWALKNISINLKKEKERKVSQSKNVIEKNNLNSHSESKKGSKIKELEKSLGLPVTLRYHKNHSGTIQIHFSTEEDFNRIINKLI